MSDRGRFAAGMSRVDDDTLMTSADTTRFTNAKNGTIWDPRADLDDDGDVDASDQTLYDAKQPNWASDFDGPTVAQAFSDVDNPFLFQGVPHFALDTAADATEDKLSLNHHRARFADCPTGRWTTRDPKYYSQYSLSQLYFFGGVSRVNQLLTESSLFALVSGNPNRYSDPEGLDDGQPDDPCIVALHVCANLCLIGQAICNQGCGGNNACIQSCGDLARLCVRGCGWLAEKCQECMN